MQPVVFIIEDDPELGSIFSEILTDYMEIGLQTEWITNGDQAITRLQESSPNQVVLDLHLPGVSGLDILKYIRSDTRLEKTAVMVVTADVIGAVIAQELADVVLIKPTGIDQIMSTAKQLLGIESK